MKVNSIASFPTLLRLAFGEARDLNPSLLAESSALPTRPFTLTVFWLFYQCCTHLCPHTALNYILMNLEKSTQMGL